MRQKVWENKKWLCELLVIQKKCGEQFLVLDDQAEPEGRTN